MKLKDGKVVKVVGQMKVKQMKEHDYVVFNLDDGQRGYFESSKIVNIWLCDDLPEGVKRMEKLK